jgi:hypothetical protein
MESYTRTLVEATAAKSLIPKPPGVLANNRSMSMKVKKKTMDGAIRAAVAEAARREARKQPFNLSGRGPKHASARS